MSGGNANVIFRLFSFAYKRLYRSNQIHSICITKESRRMNLSFHTPLKIETIIRLNKDLNPSVIRTLPIVIWLDKRKSNDQHIYSNDLS